MRSFFSEPPSRIQRWGMYLACLLIFISLGIRFYLKQQAAISKNTSIQFPMNWDSLLVEQALQSERNDSLISHPFEFNPNTVNEKDLQRMGLRHKVIATWLRYREKGGRFYHPEQVKRLYALRDTEYAQLAPFIRIENKPYNVAPKAMVELNKADTTALMALPGIGAKRALSIIDYRNQLGGYYSPAQLLEIWCIDTATYLRIKSNLRVERQWIKPLPLLDITWIELKKHPYFGGEIGRALLAFRKAKNYHIDSIDEIMEIKAIDSNLFRKIAPYLSLKQVTQN